MSHAVTVTRTTTTTTTSAILINTGYFKTYPGILKLFEMLIGIVVVGILSHFYPDQYGRSAEAFYLVTAVACLVGTTCLIISSVLSISTASILPKTLFEVTFHSVAFVLYLAAGITYLMNVENYKHSSYRTTHYEPLLAAAILGLINAALYLISTVLAYRSYKGK